MSGIFVPHRALREVLDEGTEINNLLNDGKYDEAYEEFTQWRESVKNRRIYPDTLGVSLLKMSSFSSLYMNSSSVENDRQTFLAKMDGNYAPLPDESADR